jgi:hypothetical protein
MASRRSPLDDDGMHALRAAAVALAAVFVVSGAAQGSQSDSGGSDIASAPELPLGHQVSGGQTEDARGNYEEYWTVTTLSGDVLNLVVSSTSAAGVVVCLYAPAVTDSNLSEAECHQTETVTGQGLETFVFNLTTPGRWTFAIHGSIRSEPFNYAATGTVVRRAPATRTATKTALRVKRQARLRRAVAILGSVTPHATGRIMIQVRKEAPRTRWITLLRVPLTATSQFNYTTRFTRLGMFTVRTAYLGDSTHLPSVATASIRIIR